MTRALHLLRGAFFAFLSIVGFASTFVVGGTLTKELHVAPGVLAAVRFVVAGGMLLALSLATPKGRSKLFAIPKSEWKRLLWLGPLGTSVMAWCVFMGCARVSTANASMADALSPLGIFLVGVLLTRRATFLQMLGLAFGFAGALLVVQIVTPGGIQLSAYGIGDVFILLSALAWGVYSVCGREPIRRIGASAFSTWTMLLGAGFFLLLLAAGELLDLAGATSFQIVWPHDARTWGLVLFLGLFSTLLPFWTWNAAQKDLPLSVLGATAYFTPVVAVLMAWWLVGEAATPCQWLGTLLICASALVESGRKHGNE